MPARLRQKAAFLGEANKEGGLVFTSYNPRIFIITAGTMTGMNLQIARRAVLFKPMYSEQTAQQAKTRVCRIDQVAPGVFYYILKSNNMGETHVVDIS